MFPVNAKGAFCAYVLLDHTLNTRGEKFGARDFKTCLPLCFSLARET